MLNLISSVANGIAFQCKRCGICCSSRTDGYIYLYMEDIVNLAQFLGCTIAEFAQKYLRIVYYKFHLWNSDLEDTGERKILPILVLNTEKIQDCMFLGEKTGIKLCMAYLHRPFQCQSYPCWSIILTENEADFETARKTCSAFQIDYNQGEEFPIEILTRDQIIQWLKRERQIESEYYHIMQAKDFDIFRVYPFLLETTLMLPPNLIPDLTASETHKL